MTPRETETGLIGRVDFDVIDQDRSQDTKSKTYPAIREPETASARYKKKVLSFRIGSIANAPQMLTTPPDTRKAMAAPEDIPCSINPRVNGNAAYPSRYAGAPTNTAKGMAHHTSSPTNADRAWAGSTALSAYSAAKAGIKQIRISRVVAIKFRLKLARREASDQMRAVNGVCSEIWYC